MHTTTDAAVTDGSQPPVAADGRLQRWTLPLTGSAASLLTAAGLTGVGDAPHPTQSDALIAGHFRDVRGAVLATAPLGQLGAVAAAGFLVALARHLRHPAATMASTAVVAGGVISCAYLLLLHVVFASLAYEVAASSPAAAKALFVTTILAVPAFGLGVCIGLAGAAVGGVTTGLLPTWWTVLSTAGASLAAVATISYDETGYFSPDVQQQVVGNVLLIWLVVTSVALARRGPGTVR